MKSALNTPGHIGIFSLQHTREEFDFVIETVMELFKKLSGLVVKYDRLESSYWQKAKCNSVALDEALQLGKALALHKANLSLNLQLAQSHALSSIDRGVGDAGKNVRIFMVQVESLRQRANGVKKARLTAWLDSVESYAGSILAPEDVETSLRDYHSVARPPPTPESEEDEDEKDDESRQDENRIGTGSAAGSGIKIELSFREQNPRIARVPNRTVPYHIGKLWNLFEREYESFGANLKIFARINYGGSAGELCLRDNDEMFHACSKLRSGEKLVVDMRDSPPRNTPPAPAVAAAASCSCMIQSSGRGNGQYITANESTWHIHSLPWSPSATRQLHRVGVPWDLYPPTTPSQWQCCENQCCCNHRCCDYC